MIGAAKNFASTAPVVSYNLFISPKPSITATNNEGSVTSAAVTAAASGGSEPYTYAWLKLSGDSEISISSTTSNVVTFSASGVNEDVFSAIYQCTSEDALTNKLTETVAVGFLFTGGI